MSHKPIQEDELRVWHSLEYHFLNLLNGEVSLEETLENILSFRNSIYYTGTDEEFKIVKEDHE